MPRRKTARPFEKEIGKRFQIVRQSKSLSQEAVAAAIGSGKGHISNIEAGLVAPTFETVVRLCRSLHISLDALAEGVETAEHGEASDLTQRNPPVISNGGTASSCPKTIRSAQ